MSGPATMDHDKETATAEFSLMERNTDARLEIIANYTLASFRVKFENWQKMLTTDHYRHIIMDWLNNPQRSTLVITLSTGGMLIAKSDVSDLYAPVVETAPPPLTESATAQIVLATTNTAASGLALEVPLPAPTSSFSTLDGVPRGKYIYFTRRQANTILNANNFQKEVIFGDIPLHSKIETVALFFDEMFKPMLNTFFDFNNCPEIVSKDLKLNMKSVEKTLTEIKGKTNNRTVLSLLMSPTVIAEVEAETRKGNLQSALDGKFRSLMEEMFINWTTQMHDIIKEKTSCLVDASTNTHGHGKMHETITTDTVVVTLPIHEVNFWINRKHNLQNIYDQLQTYTHKSLAYILERIDSVYQPTFLQIFQHLVMAWHEAQEITLWLPPIQRQTSAFNAVNFPNSRNLIPPLVHVVHLIWSNCRYYATTQRMSVMLRCLCNLLVHRAREDLELPTLFQNDYEEGLMKLSKTIEILEFFRTTLCAYRDKYSHNLLPALNTNSSTSAVDNNNRVAASHVNVSSIESTTIINSNNNMQELWRFANEDIFKDTLDEFIAQVLAIQNLFRAAVSFQNLEKLEIGGLRGKFLADKMKLLHEEFKLLFEKNATQEMDLSQRSKMHKFNSCDLSFMKWKENVFGSYVKVLENKLATILVQAFMDSYTWEHLHKLCIMFGSMWQGQSMLAEMQPVLSHIFNIYNQELQLLEESVHNIIVIYDDCHATLSSQSLPKNNNNNIPAVAASLMCLQQHLCRCDAFDATELNDLIMKLVGIGSEAKIKYENLKARKNILITKLINLQMKICENWKQTIEKRIHSALEAHIVKRVRHTADEKQSDVEIQVNKSVEFDANEMCIQTNSSDELFTILKEAKYLLAIESTKCKTSQLNKNNVNWSLSINNDNGISSVDEIDDDAVNGSTQQCLLPAAMYELYGKRDELWKRKIKLIKITEFYNSIRNGVRSKCELALINAEMEKIDECIDIACRILTWKSYDAELMENLYKSTQNLNARLQQIEKNFQTIFNHMQRWSREPLHQRSLFARNLLDLQQQRVHLSQRLKQCSETRTLLNRLLIANFCLFFNYNQLDFDHDIQIQEFLHHFPDEKCRKYNKYLNEVNKLLQKEMRLATKISLTYLHKEISSCLYDKKNSEYNNNMDKHNMTSTNDEKGNISLGVVGMPLFEVQLKLLVVDIYEYEDVDVEMIVDKTAQISFTPAFDLSVENNFQQIVEQLLQDISQMSDSMPRIVPDIALSDDEGDDDSANDCANKMLWLSHKEKEMDMNTYKQSPQQEELDIQLLISSIQQAVNDTIIAGLEYAQQFHIYSFLWQLEQREVLKRTLSLVEQEALLVGTGYAIMNCFKKEIDRFNELHDEIYQLNDYHDINGWVVVDIKPLKYALLNQTCKWSTLYKSWLLRYVKKTHERLMKFIEVGFEVLQLHVPRTHLQSLLRLLSIMAQIKQNESYVDNIFKPLREITALVKTYNVAVDPKVIQINDQLPIHWNHLQDLALSKAEALHETIIYQQQRVTAQINIYECQVKNFHIEFNKMQFFHVPCANVYELCDRVVWRLESFRRLYERLSRYARLLSIVQPDSVALQHCGMEVKRIKQLWDFVRVIESCVAEWHATPWQAIDTDEVENECKKFTRELRNLDKTIRLWAPYVHIVNVLKDLTASLRPITDLQNSAITERHWLELMQTTKLTRKHKIEFLISFKTNLNKKFSDLLELKIHLHEDEIKNTLDCALKEMTVTKILEDINATWSVMSFELEPHTQRNELEMLKVSEELIETLDDNQMQLQNIASSKHIDNLIKKLTHWQALLTSIDTLIEQWFEVQRKWIYLESIFIGSPDIREQLPQQTQQFEAIDAEFIQLLQELGQMRLLMHVVLQKPNIFMQLQQLQKQLAVCEKALNDYLELKRMTFPRFYFISAADLLDILSNGNDPSVIHRHLVKLFDSILRLEYQENTQLALGMYSKENDEYVAFTNISCSQVTVACTGRVEVWLNAIVSQMRNTLRALFHRALLVSSQPTHEQWLLNWPAQVSLCCNQICWTSDVNRAFAWLEDGYEAAMKELHKRQIAQLNALINLLLGELTPGDRQKIMTICTIDVHSRDVVGKIVQAKVSNSTAFQWQSQLRHRWDETTPDNNFKGSTNDVVQDYKEDCFANICDAEFRYAYEYLGNTSRLVITPLTDRCYITLSQSLHLNMGGAPAGPAGTGKTETTKDLGRSLGVMVYVFNCSEQMDYKSCGNIYKGLAQTGAWGCFDEFNRISVEVLSVIAVQVKTIQEAIKIHKREFLFMGEQIALVPSVGIFITMNPGYAGRTELPENLKTLFRPCAMIVPDFALICEIMLVAEGFQEARLLARKFITLYTLCKELLSKQDHYDWGLRAIKSVLIVAGSLKREDRTRPEDQILMRALRDFNMPKIVTEDVSIFVGLIGDLFPALDVPRKRLFDFEKVIRRAIGLLKLQPEDNFLMKVVQLQELLDVRHSVFIVGNAGTGKTRIWQTLLETYRIQKRKPVYNVLNPKALSNDELFGVVNATTREWKDGLFSAIMRVQANMPAGHPKWMVLDGDIDPMWIESLNTLMDDNKILTLASNERIPLTKDMRLLFEVGNLSAATPATVSRAGVLYINPQDLGWSPYILSWLETRHDIIERGILTTLFEKYFPIIMQKQKIFKRIVPITDIAMIQMTCFLLECIIDKVKEIPAQPISMTDDSHSLQHNVLVSDSMELIIEQIFVYCTMNAFGAALSKDSLIDWHREFHKWWVSEFKEVKLPAQGTIFDYYLNTNTMKFQRWSELLPALNNDAIINTDAPIQNIMIHTAETTRLTYFLKLLTDINLPCLLVGPAGSGKNMIFNELFNIYKSEQDTICNSTDKSSMEKGKKRTLALTVQSTYFNYYTCSEHFQKIIDLPLEKKAGRSYAPQGANRHLIYFINDLNMPEVDAFGTVGPHTIMRQFMDYRQWYDRQKLQVKAIRHCQFAAVMNPTAGSFTIDSRLQRHFCVFSLSAPQEETMQFIYNSILSAHLENPVNNFCKEIRSIGKLLVQVGISLHKRVESCFLSTALKFHYIFNMRDLTAVYQGLMNTMGTVVNNAQHYMTTGVVCNKPVDLIRLYVHEAFRIYHDRLVDLHDIKAFKTFIRDIFKKDFEDFDEDFVFSEPLLYSHFAQSLVDQKYMAVKSWSHLQQLLLEAQSNYNEVMGYLNLVLFEDAMIHLCRINRILECPMGNALLIGVGGSGKQTLARLAAFISSLTVFQIQLKRGFCLQDLKEELAALYMRVGLKNIPSVFLLSDAQISNESHLMMINDILSSGEIPELFSDDQVETIINGIRNEVKQSGTLDTKENCWRFFTEKVKRNLKIVLCFSPVGQTLRVRARKFPALIKRTTIDCFHEWPKSALETVSKQFLTEITNILPNNLVNPISEFMAYVHASVNQISKVYLQNEKRFNYTTPKTFLEYIYLYRKLLNDKNTEYLQRIQRLQGGMAKLAECATQVDTLKNQLAVQEVQLTAKNIAADKLIAIVSAESEKIKQEKYIASDEEKRVRIIEEDVSIKTKLCEDDLRKAEPALIAAQEALNTLNKNNLTELKSFGSPPKAVVHVCAAVMVLLAKNGKIPRDRSWKAAKLMMVRVDQFLNDLVTYEKDNIHPNIIEALQNYLKDPEFNPDKIVQKSVAAAGLCAWVININRYHQVFLIVGPKQKALQDSQNELLEARQSLGFLKEKINALEAQLSAMQKEFEEAVLAKRKCQAEADKTSFTIDLAHRLINGLATENVRWKESVLSNPSNEISQNKLRITHLNDFSLQSKMFTLPGDILLVASFLSYAGCFSKRYREELQQNMWMQNFQTLKPSIPFTKNADPLLLFTDDAQIAAWNNEGLPMDRMSTENATILTHSTRWPLMIDPQLQGIKWIKNNCGADLIIVRVTQKGFMDILEKSIAKGETVLLQQIEETVDTVLEPLLSRTLIKKGRYIRIGDKEIDFNENFRLILHTKLANPHYKPEMQAQTTLINFTVTPDGLEEQLLAEVVRIERPDLEQMKMNVTIQQNKFKISLKQLEDELLARLTSASKNVLDDHALVINLEATKATVIDIELKVVEARNTTVQIDDARNIYRSAARRAAILYFVLTDLSRINPLYKFSLKSFMNVFKQAIAQAPKCQSYDKRVLQLVDNITLHTFRYIQLGLFERDKLTFASHLVLRIMIAAEQVSKEEVDFILRYPHDPNTLSPFDFISRSAWGGIKTLSLMEHFYGIDKDIENYIMHWKKLLDCNFPEIEPLPGEWKHRSALQKLCIIRALRPDRMTYAIKLFIQQVLSPAFTQAVNFSFSELLKETSCNTPIFFVLSPGVDPIRDVELFASRSEINILNISLGQGQEVLAEQAIAKAMKSNSHWVILQNVHLVVNWLRTLEKLIERLGNNHEMSLNANFRLFITAEPAPDPQYHVIPQGILESSLKIVNEPPAGLAANMHKSWNNFTQETLEACTQEAEFKSILFTLCYFHAVVGERRKFGTQGWNKVYPFNVGDLHISMNVLHNYLEGSTRIPWEDLRYLFGEIMYGGHITDDWDRRLCRTYLEELLKQELIDGDFELCPGFPAPPNLDYQGYHRYIKEMLPPESPELYGLHKNAEIGFLTNHSEQLLRTVFELQPRESEISTHCIAPREELVRIMADDFLDKLQDEFNIQALLIRVERKTPFVVVALQECERMNLLIREVKRSLRELMLGLKGELTMTQDMESLDNAIFYDHIPHTWANLAYPSLLGLQAWFANLIHRIKELTGWINDFKLPCTIWLGGLFNPQSFLTAIMQESARRHDLPLDRMRLNSNVTKKEKDDVSLPPIEGAYIHGLYLEGASWDCQLNSIVCQQPKQLLFSMPVMYIKSVVQEKQDLQKTYECPLYKTRLRGDTYVWTFNLKTRTSPAKWILGGVALLLQT